MGVRRTVDLDLNHRHQSETAVDVDVEHTRGPYVPLTNADGSSTTNEDESNRIHDMASPSIAAGKSVATGDNDVNLAPGTEKNSVDGSGTDSDDPNKTDNKGVCATLVPTWAFLVITPLGGDLPLLPFIFMCCAKDTAEFLGTPITNGFQSFKNYLKNQWTGGANNRKIRRNLKRKMGDERKFKELMLKERRQKIADWHGSTSEEHKLLLEEWNPWLRLSRFSEMYRLWPLDSYYPGCGDEFVRQIANLKHEYSWLPPVPCNGNEDPNLVSEDFCEVNEEENSPNESASVEPNKSRSGFGGWIRNSWRKGHEGRKRLGSSFSRGLLSGLAESKEQTCQGVEKIVNKLTGPMINAFKQRNVRQLPMSSAIKYKRRFCKDKLKSSLKDVTADFNEAVHIPINGEERTCCCPKNDALALPCQLTPKNTTSCTKIFPARSKRSTFERRMAKDWQCECLLGDGWINYWDTSFAQCIVEKSAVEGNASLKHATATENEDNLVTDKPELH